MIFVWKKIKSSGCYELQYTEAALVGVMIMVTLETFEEAIFQIIRKMPKLDLLVVTLP